MFCGRAEADGKGGRLIDVYSHLDDHSVSAIAKCMTSGEVAVRLCNTTLCEEDVEMGDETSETALADVRLCSKAWIVGSPTNMTSCMSRRLGKVISFAIRAM